jgi:hypothetical protein
LAQPLPIKPKLTDIDRKNREGKKYNVSTDPIDFHTPYLQLVETESWWTLSQENGTAGSTAKIDFQLSGQLDRIWLKN